jgi:hypothetical protein
METWISESPENYVQPTTTSKTEPQLAHRALIRTPDKTDDDLEADRGTCDSAFTTAAHGHLDPDDRGVR